MNYWEECIRIGLEEAGIEATDEQIAMIAMAKGEYVLDC